MKPKLTLPERERLLRRVLENGESITQVCREAGISRVIFYRWLKRIKGLNVASKTAKINTKELQAAVMPKKGTIPLKPHFGMDVKLRAINEVINQGHDMNDVCKKYNISKTIFYRWLHRYKSAGEDISLASNGKDDLHEIPLVFNEQKAIEGLQDKKPQIHRYANQVSDEYEQLVLNAVKEYPELSSHKLVQILPFIGNKPVVGNHGVQNILRRHNLTTYKKRLEFAQISHRDTYSITVGFQRFIHILKQFLMLPLRTQNWITAFAVGLAIPLVLSIVTLGLYSYIKLYISAPTFSVGICYIFSSLALLFGTFFLFYSFKYYISVLLVLVFSRRYLDKTGNDITLQNGKQSAHGLVPDVSNVKLDRHPFVSIHLPLYNEKRVVNRLLEAATSMDYDNFEVIVCDDSTDETTQIVNEWANHPKVKISHRQNREGYKGGALAKALTLMDKRTEFVLVFDADFMPYPDSIEQFLKYFKSITGSLEPNNYKKSNYAVVQGYQWHVLNKSENWITRGVRTEYAGSYVIERSSEEIYGGIKQISGSVYMIRADMIRQYGWGTSITEDFELTLRLYKDGYKVAYTPYIQAPSECVSTLKRLIRQRMRWAEGHSHNIKKMFWSLLKSSKTSKAEKFEFLYLSPYYLQSFFFLVGTLFWFVSEAIFQVQLPFWTEVWGWSLVLTNLFSLPLMNTVGMFLEEAEEKDYLGILSFVALTYIITPFQAYAAIKGFFEKSEGPWFRTPKTGRITDIYRRGRFYRWLYGLVKGPQGNATGVFESISLKTLAKPALNLHYSTEKIIHHGRLTWVGKTVLAMLLTFTVTLVYFSYGVPQAQAAAQTYYFHTGSGGDWGSAPITSSANYMNETAPSSSAGAIFNLARNISNSGTANYTWYSDLLPSGDDPAYLGTGQYQINIVKAGNAQNAVADIVNIGMQIFVTDANGNSQNQIMGNRARVRANNAQNTAFTYNVGNLTSNYEIPSTNKQRIGVRLHWNAATNAAADRINLLINNSSAPMLLQMPNFQVPEVPQMLIIPLFVLAPLVPQLVKMSRQKRRRKNIFDETFGDLRLFLVRLTGYDPSYVEENV